MIWVKVKGRMKKEGRAEIWPIEINPNADKRGQRTNMALYNTQSGRDRKREG